MTCSQIFKHIFTNIRKYSQIFTNIHTYSQTFTNIRKYSHIHEMIQEKITTFYLLQDDEHLLSGWAHRCHLGDGESIIPRGSEGGTSNNSTEDLQYMCHGIIQMTHDHLYSMMTHVSLSNLIYITIAYHCHLGGIQPGIPNFQKNST